MRFFREKFLILLMFGGLILGIGMSTWALKNIRDQSILSSNMELNYEVSKITHNEQSINIVQEDSTLDMFSSTSKDESKIILEPLDLYYSSKPIKSQIVSTVKIPDLEKEVSIVEAKRKEEDISDAIESRVIGTLTIPDLEKVLPIVEGTEKDDLELGVGHFSGSVLPGENDNCVLSGHRGTVFAKLDELEIGNQLIVKTSTGTFIYEIMDTRIVDKDDKTVIVPTDHAVLTLTTCYPFNFIGNAPNRYIVSADMINIVTE